MKQFNSLAAFAKHIDNVTKKYPVYEKLEANFVGEALEKEAKDKIGHLQPGWEPLAASTIEDKIKKGYVFNADYNPLYRTGELRDSIHHVYYAAGHTLFLGSDSDIMVYQEKGTKYIPPRPVISTTMYQAYPVVNYVMGEMLTQWVSGTPLRLRSKTYGVKNGSI